MTQLIINGTTLPEVDGQKYTVDYERLSVSVQMISGRTVQEVRGNVPIVSYTAGLLDNSTMAALMTAMRSHTALTVSYLPQESTTGALTEAAFVVDSFTAPQFLLAQDSTPYWTGFACKLRGVRPVD